MQQQHTHELPPQQLLQHQPKIVMQDKVQEQMDFQEQLLKNQHSDISQQENLLPHQQENHQPRQVQQKLHQQQDLQNLPQQDQHLENFPKRNVQKPTLVDFVKKLNNPPGNIFRLLHHTNLLHLTQKHKQRNKKVKNLRG